MEEIKKKEPVEGQFTLQENTVSFTSKGSKQELAITYKDQSSLTISMRDFRQNGNSEYKFINDQSFEETGKNGYLSGMFNYVTKAFRMKGKIRNLGHADS